MPLFQNKDTRFEECQKEITDLNTKTEILQASVSALKDQVSHLDPARVVEIEAKIAQLWQLLTTTTPITKKPTLTRAGQSLRRMMSP